MADKNELVLHRPAIDHGILQRALGALERGKSGEAFDAHVLGGMGHGHRIVHKVTAHDAGGAAFCRFARRCTQPFALFRHEGKAYFRMRQCQT